MLELAGDKAAAANAKEIVALETQLAKVQWTKVELRNPVKTYNKVEFAKLGRHCSEHRLEPLPHRHGRATARPITW